MVICWSLHVRRRMPKQISINHRQFVCVYVFFPPAEHKQNRKYNLLQFTKMQRAKRNVCTLYSIRSAFILRALYKFNMQFENWKLVQEKRAEKTIWMQFTFRYFRSRRVEQTHRPHQNTKWAAFNASSPFILRNERCGIIILKKCVAVSAKLHLTEYFFSAIIVKMIYVMPFWRNAYWFIIAKRSSIVLFLFIFRFVTRISENK